MNEILWCDHSNESSLPVLTHGDINFVLSQNKIWKLGWKLLLAKFGSESVKAHLPDGQGRVQAGHAPTKSLPKTRKLSYQRQVKWQSCLLKGSAGIQVFSSTDIGA